jgi:uncharacterized protein
MLSESAGYSYANLEVTAMLKVIAFDQRSAEGDSMMMDELPFDLSAMVAVCQRYDVAKLGVFGSFARGEADENSDLDLLVEFRKRVSLLKMVALERELSAAVGRKVDLLTEAAISPYLRDSILRDLQVIMSRSDTVYLQHILDAITKVENYLTEYY